MFFVLKYRNNREFIENSTLSKIKARKLGDESVQSVGICLMVDASEDDFSALASDCRSLDYSFAAPRIRREFVMPVDGAPLSRLVDPVRLRRT
jgi:hypothetical protein